MRYCTRNVEPLTSNSTVLQGRLSMSSFKGTVMQIEKALINDRLHISEVS